jgi:hypothetical protein
VSTDTKLLHHSLLSIVSAGLHSFVQATDERASWLGGAFAVPQVAAKVVPLLIEVRFGIRCDATDLHEECALLLVAHVAEDFSHQFWRDINGGFHFDLHKNPCIYSLFPVLSLAPPSEKPLDQEHRQQEHGRKRDEGPAEHRAEHARLWREAMRAGA